MSDLRREYDNADTASTPLNSNLASAAISTTSLSHVLARIAELRPVLPKPSAAGPCHDPSSGVAHTHPDRHHTHDNMFYSPYGRAYEFTHGSHHEQGHGDRPHKFPQPAVALPPNEESYPDPSAQLPLWDPSISFPSVCGCGDGCSCPGCIEHNGALVGTEPTVGAFNSCSNPGACNACLDCTILSLPNSLPPDTALSIYGAHQSDFIDEWLRQVSGISTSISPASDFEASSAPFSEPEFVQAPWETFQLPDNPEVEQVPDVAPREAGALCVCPIMRSNTHRDICITDGVVFAALGKRMSCPQMMDRSAGPVFRDVPDGDEIFSGPSGYVDTNGYLTTPQLPRSRSSSGSSFSNPGASQCFYVQSSSAGPFTGALDVPTRGPFLEMMFVAPQTDSPALSEYEENAYYAISNPDSDGSLEDRCPQYDPALEGTQQY